MVLEKIFFNWPITWLVELKNEVKT